MLYFDIKLCCYRQHTLPSHTSSLVDVLFILSTYLLQLHVMVVDLLFSITEPTYAQDEQWIAAPASYFVCAFWDVCS